MSKIKIKTSTSARTRCSVCNERIITGQLFSRIEKMNYCHNGNCLTYLPRNHMVDVEPDVERDSERERETFASYVTNGCTEHYWKDKEAGY